MKHLLRYKAQDSGGGGRAPVIPNFAADYKEGKLQEEKQGIVSCISIQFDLFQKSKVLYYTNEY